MSAQPQLAMPASQPTLVAAGTDGRATGDLARRGDEDLRLDGETDNDDD